MELAEVTVTEELPTLTTPVKSSMRSSCPEERLLPARGRAKALRTLAFAKLTFRLAPEIDKRLLRLRAMPRPVTLLEETAKARLACEVPAATMATCGQPVLAGQVWSVLAVSLKKVMIGLEKEMMAPVYWPEGTLANVPRKRVSDCRRMRSTTGEPLRLRACWVPPEVIREIPVMVTLKVRREGWAGRVSATMVRVTVPVPPHTPPGQMLPPF